MAKYINPVATGLAIGQGEAQVFDTSGIWAAKIKAKDDAKKEKEKKEKELLDSLVEMDTSKLWDRDLGQYNEQWSSYRQYIKDNFKALQNPSKNPDIWTEKKRMEQQMLQFVNSSAQASKLDIELQKMFLNDKTGQLRDKEGMYADWRNKSGNFANPFEYIDRKPDELGSLLKGYMSTAVAAYDKDSIIERKDPKTGDLIKTTVKGSSPEKWQEMYSTQYETNNMWQRSAEEAWEAAGGAQKTGFSTPKEYAINEAMNYRPQEKYGKDITQKSGGITFGGYGVPTGLNVSSDVVETETVNVSGTTVTDDKRRVLFTKATGAEMPTMNVNLQGKVSNVKGEDVTEKYKDGLQGAKVESIVEISGGKNPRYEVQYSVPIGKADNQAEINRLQIEMTGLEKPTGWNPLTPGALKEYEEKILELKNKQEALIKEQKESEGKKGFEIIRVPIDSVTNIADLETNLGFAQGTLLPNLPNLLTKQAEGGTDTDPLKLNE